MNGYLTWYCQMIKITDKMIKSISVHCGLTMLQCVKLFGGWAAVKGNLMFLEDPKKASRHFYEGLLNITSGYISKNANRVKNDKMLTKKQQDKLITEDHWLSGQVFGRYVSHNFFELYDIRENMTEEQNLARLIAYVEECKVASQTVIVTKDENTKLSKLTEKGCNIVVPTLQRYKECNMATLWDVERGIWTTKFPFQLSGEFLKYEKEHLLI